MVKNKTLLSDLKYLKNFNHTGSLEVYHSLYNKYCPKRLHFSYEGMIARSQLAVLDFNSGVGLCHAETTTGKLRYKQQFSRVTQTWVIKKIKESKNKSYIGHLLNEALHLKLSGENYPVPKLENIPKNIATIEKPNKEKSVKNMATRFLL